MRSEEHSAKIRELARRKIVARDTYNALMQCNQPKTMDARVDLELRIQTANREYQEATEALLKAAK